MNFAATLVNAVLRTSVKLIGDAIYPSTDAIYRNGIKINKKTITQIKNQLVYSEELIIPDELWAMVHANRKPNSHKFLEDKMKEEKQVSNDVKSLVKLYKNAWNNITSNNPTIEDINKMREREQEQHGYDKKGRTRYPRKSKQPASHSHYSMHSV